MEILQLLKKFNQLRKCNCFGNKKYVHCTAHLNGNCAELSRSCSNTLDFENATRVQTNDAFLIAMSLQA